MVCSLLEGQLTPATLKSGFLERINSVSIALRMRADAHAGKT
jgi:hypothetical protein